MDMDRFKVTNYLSKEGLHQAREGHYEINLAFEVLVKDPILPFYDNSSLPFIKAVTTSQNVTQFELVGPFWINNDLSWVGLELTTI